MGKKSNRRYSKELVKGAFGVLLFLLCLLFFLSPSTHLRYISYPFIGGLGYLGYYSLLLLGLYLGAKSLFLKKAYRFKAREVFAYLLLILCLGVLLTHLGYQGQEDPGQVALLGDALSEGYEKEGFLLYGDIRLCGGLLCYELSGLLNLAGGWLVILFFVLILILSLILFFLPLLKKGYLALRSGRALKKARGRRPSLEREDSPLQVGEEDPDFAYHEKAIPRSSEEERNSLLTKEKEALDEWDFRPSSSLSYRSRSELQKEEDPSSPEVAPVPVSASSPIASNFKTSGVSEPVFSFESPKKEAPEQAEAPLEAIAPTPEPSQPMEEPEEPLPSFEPSFDSHEEESSLPRQEIKAEEVPVTVSEPLFSASPLPPEPAPEPIPEPFASTPAQAPIETPKMEEKKEESNNPEDAPAIPLPKYVFPDESMLDEPKDEAEAISIATAQAEENMARMNETLTSLRAGASIVSFKIGPSVTRYDVQMDIGVQVNTIFKFETDISRCLAGLPARFVPIVKDKTTSAFEIGNRKRMAVCFKEVFSALPKGEQFNMVVPFGKSIDGEVVYGDLSSFPHMLVAGTTGSGKSIFIHSMLLTLLMRNRPEDLKLLLVDPKQVEFTAYDELPNLLCPTITSPEKANVALHKLADLMDRRFEMLRKAKVRDIRGYNSVYAPAHNKRKLSFIVVVVDEFADLALQCKDVSEPIQRLGQKGRACGIHMIIATQRPDTNTISGTIKANLPVTVCLMVKNAIDSNVVLHAKGGEALLDHGDMLIDCPKLGRELIRAQGAMMGEYTELLKIPDFIRSQMGPIYDPEFLNLEPEQQSDTAASLVDMSAGSAVTKGMADEEKYQAIKGIIMQQESTSISQIQRNFGVGFPRAGKIIARLQNEGIVARSSDAPGSSKGFKVLVHVDANEGGVESGDTPGSLSSASTSYEEE